MICFSKLLLFFVLTVQSLFGEGREASTTETRKILQDHYSACLFEIIPIENRVTILNVFLNDGVEDRNWEFSYGTLSTGDTFFLKHFIASTPRAERLRLLKDGFMANNYRWLRVLYQNSTGAFNNDVSFQEVAPIFMLVGSWVMEHFNALQSEPIFTFIETFGFDDVEGFATIRYSPGQQPFFLGIADREITLNTGSETQTRILRSKTDFLENGKILFNNLYQLTDLRTYISAQGTSAPTRTGTFEYLQSYTPFEPIVIISGGQNNLGLGEGQETVVPAIVALAYQKSLLEEELQHQLRQFGNAVMVAGGVLAAPFSGGTSLAAVSAAIATGGIAVGAIDGYLQQKVRAGEVSASGELYQAWNTFYLTYGIVDAGVGGTTMAVGAFNTLKTVNLAKSYNRFNSALKNMSLELRNGLASDWNVLKTSIKGMTIPKLSDLIASLSGTLKSTYDDLINAGLTSEAKANSILLKNTNGETVAIIYNNKLTPTKWAWDYKAVPQGYTKSQTAEGYILLTKGDDVRFDLGFKEGRKLEAREVNDYLVNGQGKDLDGQPYWAGTGIDEVILGTKDEIIYFVEDFNEATPNPGQYASKDPIYTIAELRGKLAVKEAWKKTAKEPTLRAYRVKAPLRSRSGIIGPQTENGVRMSGGGHQYEVIDYLGKDWGNYLEPVGSRAGIKLQ
jgi:hypothetical protein